MAVEMKHQVVWINGAMVPDKRDEDPAKHTEVRIPRGEFLPDWVDEFTLSVLSTTGAIKTVPADAPDRVLLEAENPPAPVLLQDHSPSALGVVREPVAGTSQDPAVKTGEGSAAKGSGAPERPADNATKADWLAYARAVEKDPAKRDKLNDEVTRAELISRYG